MISLRSPKILVLAIHCIGDSLLTTCQVASLKKAFPSGNIDVLVTARGAMVYDSNPEVNKVICLPQKMGLKQYWRYLLKQFRSYDFVVNEQTSDRSAIYSWILGRRRLGIINPSEKSAWLKKLVYTDFVLEQEQYEHKIMRNLRMLSPLNIASYPSVVSPQQRIPSELIVKLPQDYIVVHAPSSNTIKQWPESSWIKLIDGLVARGYNIVLTGADSERDKQIVTSVLSGIQASEQVFSLVGQLNFAQTGTLLEQSIGFIGPDSGPGHLAAGFNIPIISIISVAPASVWSPWPKNAVIPKRASSIYQDRIPVIQENNNVTVLQSDRACVPCYQDLCKYVDQPYSPCLTDISVEQVLNATLDKLDHREPNS
ncbi:glycosyltransferase family 9 protein [Alginatibacterium sediminis]|uniref:Glycosyltransferase family 9 protein n=1 Tax=Alginatibacterium sediminis TaxID=2164068 RepID=A0A420ENI9_9ALTE|nr:glycosyltransferase family 9 protein [Alginatibacterium sediminis]RKF22156.1 glycosyltransferase family 9 protein [Alginatibacterium sediminis]